MPDRPNNRQKTDTRSPETQGHFLAIHRSVMLIDRIPGERTIAAAVRDAVNVVILVDCDQRYEPLARSAA